LKKGKGYCPVKGKTARFLPDKKRFGQIRTEVLVKIRDIRNGIGLG